VRLLQFIFLLLLVSFFSSCGKNPEEKGNQYVSDMAYSKAYEAYSESTLTADGKTMMLPPANTISREYEVFHYGPGDLEAARAGRELKSPLEKSDDNAEKGKALFQNLCLVCHGETGKGDGPIIPKFRNPPSYSSKPVSDYPEGRIYHVIMRGKGVMKPYSVQLNYKERWQIIQYVQKLQKAK
jgi:mono/diheme cytochrome c family protein